MNGILLIDKPAGWTSMDVCAKLRGALREKRVGHSGTLDPMATGLLVVFLGRATRAATFAEADEKTYEARLRLGIVTDTQDVTGTVLGGTFSAILSLVVALYALLSREWLAGACQKLALAVLPEKASRETLDIFLG